MDAEKIYRCISWIAVSSEQQAELESPEDQRIKNEEFIRNLGRYYPRSQGVLVKTFSVAASRSLPFLADAEAQLAEYAELVKLVRDRAFDLLICRSRDRLGRTSTLVNDLERLCQMHGIVVVPRMSLPPTLNARELSKSEGTGLLAAIEAQMAETEIRRLTARHEMGMYGRVVKRQLFAGRTPFGYRYRYLKGGAQEIEIDEAAAAVVRLILVDLYLEKGWGARRILAYLQEKQIPAPQGGQWAADTQVLYFIRNAHRYAGYHDHNRYSRTGREYAVVRANYPPIITEEELEAIRICLRERRVAHKGDIDHRPFAGIAICALCNRPLVAKADYHTTAEGQVVYHAMRCRACGLSISDRVLFSAAYQAIQYLQSLIDLDGLIDKQSKRRIEQAEQKIAALEKRKQEVTEQRQRVVDAYIQAGAISVEEFRQQITALDKQIAVLIGEIEQTRQALAVEKDVDARVGRLEQIRQAGTAYLSRIHDDPVGVRRYLLGFMRIYVGRQQRIERIEYV